LTAQIVGPQNQVIHLGLFGETRPFEVIHHFEMQGHLFLIETSSPSIDSGAHRYCRDNTTLHSNLHLLKNILEGNARIMMKPLIFALCVMLFGSGDLSAQTSSWQPSPGHTQVPIWPDLVPDAQPAAGPEDMKPVEDPLVAGKP
jgi:hypothetical protein